MGVHAKDCSFEKTGGCNCGMLEVDQIVGLLNKIILDQFKRGYRKGIEASKDIAMGYLGVVMKEIGHGESLKTGNC